MPCIHCDLDDLLRLSEPPDPELVDLIEWAFLEAQIDGLKADLAVLAWAIMSVRAGAVTQPEWRAKPTQRLHGLKSGCRGSAGRW